MSGVVRIEIRETAAELKDLMRQEKDAIRLEKLQVLYWLKTQMVDSVLSAAVRRTGNIVPQYKDGCLAIDREGSQNYCPRNLDPEDQKL
jgi:hypothetical protein